MLPYLENATSWLWTRDLHHWIQQRWRFIKMCGSIVTTLAISPSHPSALSYEPLKSTIFHEFGLRGWIRVALSQERHMLWTWDLHHWIQQRLKFVQALELCAAALSTFMDLVCPGTWRMSPEDFKLSTWQSNVMRLPHGPWNFIFVPVKVIIVWFYPCSLYTTCIII